MPLSKIRVYELAKMLGKSNRELLLMLHDLGVDVKTHMSSIDTETAQLVEDTVRSESPDETAEKKTRPRQAATIEVLKVTKGSTVRDVSEMLGVTPAEAVKELVDAGFMVPASASVNEEILLVLSEAFCKDFDLVNAVVEQSEETPKMKRTVFKGNNLQPRSPIVTVMGHVDHGKTTLLDFIRDTNITSREAGGITQHIGASKVFLEGKEIVFLDTPGHEAFTSMRARGTQVTDIAILVVAADDGVMPQTLEAINHAKAAGVPIVVAVNKIDKPNARPDRVRQQLSDHGLTPEEWGGDTIMVDVSAKSGLGVDHLLEMILLVAEVEELKADAGIAPEGIVIEAKLDKGKGPVATVIVKQGTLNQGDILLLDTTWGKIRAMLDYQGNQIKVAGPSTPVELLGLNGVPQPGEAFTRVDNEKIARDAISQKDQERRQEECGNVKRLTLEELYVQMQEGVVPQLNLVLKCDVQGSVEALESSLQKLATNEVGMTFIHKGVGRISESDVMLATASNAIIIAFNVRPDSKAKKLAECEGVQIRTYDVIYDVIDDITAALEGMLKPLVREEITGQAEIREVFKIPKAGKIAGCYVIDGVIRRNSKVRIIRNGIVSWQGTLSNLRRFKDDAKEVAAGYECGISLYNFQDFKEGDIIEAYELVEEKRYLE